MLNDMIGGSIKSKSPRNEINILLTISRCHKVLCDFIFCYSLDKDLKLSYPKWLYYLMKNTLFISVAMW